MQVAAQFRLCRFGFLGREKEGSSHGGHRAKSTEFTEKRDPGQGDFHWRVGNLQFWLANCGYET
jgi:hypothetical protein